MKHINLSEYEYLGSYNYSSNNIITSAWLHKPTKKVIYCNGKCRSSLQEYQSDLFNHLKIARTPTQVKVIPQNSGTVKENED